MNKKFGSLKGLVLGLIGILLILIISCDFTDTNNNAISNLDEDTLSTDNLYRGDASYPGIGYCVVSKDYNINRYGVIQNSYGENGSTAGIEKYNEGAVNFSVWVIGNPYIGIEYEAR